MIDNLDRRILDLLQREFPLESSPYAALGHKLGISEEEMLTRVGDLYKRGLIRQISAIFNTKNLGYDSCLVAIKVPPERLDAAAAVINRHSGVSHNYSRSHRFNLWFTIATPPGCDLRSEVYELGEKAKAEAILLLPALRVFKIGVKLDIAGTKDPLSTEKLPASQEGFNSAPLPSLTGSEVAVIRELQEYLPIEAKPFSGIAGRLKMTEDELFSIAERFIKQGRMRRFAAVLRHRDVGFKANAMGVWIVAPQDVERVGSQLAAFQVVSHCYERPPSPPDWPYNIFTMVHAHTKEECLEILHGMAKKVGITRYDYLFSEKEYKKARVRYFVEDK